VGARECVFSFCLFILGNCHFNFKQQQSRRHKKEDEVEVPMEDVVKVPIVDVVKVPIE
jgi:hypothetical protein